MTLNNLFKAAATTVALLATQLANAEAVVLKFGSGTPARAPISQFFAQWAEKVTQDSNGTLQIQFVPNGVLGTDGQMVERVRNGVAQIGWDLTSYYPGKYPKMDVATLPLLVDTAEGASVAMWQVYEKGLLNDEFSDLVPIMFIGYANMSVITRAPVVNADALKGMKISAGGRIRSQTVANMGAVPVALKTPDLYTSLQRGVVDGSMTVFATLAPFKLQEVVSHGLIAPFGGGSGFVMMSRQAYAALPPEARKVLNEHSGLAASRDAGRVVDKIEREAIESFKAMPGKTVRVMSAAEIDKLRPQFQAVEQAWLQATSGGAEVLGAYRAVLKSGTSK